MTSQSNGGSGGITRHSGRVVNDENVRIKSPYVLGNVTRMKMLLPVGKERAWDLIATSEGLTSWFPAGCAGTVRVGEFLTFAWEDGSVDRVRVRRLGEKHSSLSFDWRHGAELRVYLHGRLTTLTLEVEYEEIRKRKDQRQELPRWAVRLANLKSCAMHRRDLRNGSTLSRRSWKVGFIDGGVSANQIDGDCRGAKMMRRPLVAGLTRRVDRVGFELLVPTVQQFAGRRDVALPRGNRLKLPARSPSMRLAAAEGLSRPEWVVQGGRHGRAG